VVRPFGPSAELSHLSTWSKVYEHFELSHLSIGSKLCEHCQWCHKTKTRVPRPRLEVPRLAWDRKKDRSSHRQLVTALCLLFVLLWRQLGLCISSGSMFETFLLIKFCFSMRFSIYVHKLKILHYTVEHWKLADQIGPVLTVNYYSMKLNWKQ